MFPEIELFFEYREAEGLRPRTISWYRRHIADFVVTMEVESLDDWTAPTLARFLAIKRKTCNQTTMKMYWRTLTYASRWLYLQRYLPEDPTPRIPKPRYTYEQKQGFSLEEAQAMLEAARRSYRPLFTRALLLVLYDTGIRAGELCSLTRSRVNVGGSEIVVRGKTGERPVPVGKVALRAMQRYMQVERRAAPEVDEVFVTYAGTPLTSAYLSQKVRRLAQAAGIERPYIGPHALRHGFALQYLRNGGDVLHLRQTLGHRSTQMTEQYVRLLPRHLQEAHDRFSPASQL